MRYVKNCYLSLKLGVVVVAGGVETILIYLSLTIGSFVGCYEEYEKPELGRCNQQKPVNLDSMATLQILIGLCNGA